ncbi:MAG: fucose operon FucU protein [Lachnospiraceae bacterium]|nr:fucose operon FucU protein [Lachnospiraceae bacterium]
MLKKIPNIISPELMFTMMSMGHSDVLILADANFPGSAHARELIRADGILIPELLDAILSLFPLDGFVDYPVKLMRNLSSEPVPEIWETYRDIIIRHDEEKVFTDFEYLDRLPFYEYAESAYAIVQTGDTSRYANIVLQKGVC